MNDGMVWSFKSAAEEGDKRDDVGLGGPAP